MIASHYDRRTMVAMEAALEQVCACWPNGGTHQLRKRVARSIIRCAQTGNINLDALIEAGARGLAQRGRKGADSSFDQHSAA
jgi:hypothetical protein